MQRSITTYLQFTCTCLIAPGCLRSVCNSLKAERSISHPQSWNSRVSITSNSPSSAKWWNIGWTTPQMYLSNSPKYSMFPSKCMSDWEKYIYRPCQSLWQLCVHIVKKKKNPQVRRLKRAVRKVMCWWWKISPVHWCQLAIHSPDNANVLDSGSSYTWIIMCWWVWASVCHETRMTEW